jgi:hypothetical protein
MGKRALYSYGGKKNPIPASKAKRKPRRKKTPASKFYPKDYSITELRSIAKGGTPEAWIYSMRRSDVPKGARKKASTELKRRKNRK